MSGHTIRILFTQCLQLRPGHAVKVVGLHIIRDDRIIVTSPYGLSTEGVAILDFLGCATLVTRSGPTLAVIPGKIRIGPFTLRTFGR